ncbi:ubiquitin hydrolase [Fusarium austroafricanum]|uniref:Ubiquitin hydrolase n=1 Tax=Fusarium austroafricanum TaxID=2364996 RepID=A0A8H4NWK8_9HYPO|nr:ubiquitin hydrolase [Fusarium austroafricanum]
MRLSVKDDALRLQDLQVEWKSFPATSMESRFIWVLDLLADTRALGWCYSASKGVPCQFHSKASPEMFRDMTEKLRALVMVAFLRLLLALTWLDFCQTYIFPSLRVTLMLLQEKHNGEDTGVEIRWLFDLINCLTSLSSSFACIETFYNTSRLISVLSFLAGNPTSLIGVSQPSPWGSLSAMYYQGIGGSFPLTLCHVFPSDVFRLLGWVLA